MPITAQQAANSQAGLAAESPPVWYAVRDTNGAIGLQSTPPGGNALKSIAIGEANTLNDLVANFSTKLATALGQIGGTASQQASLIAELDSGAALNGAKRFLYVGPSSTPGGKGANGVSSDAPTKIGSEAVGTSVIPGTTGIVNALSNISAGSFLGVLANLGFWKGIGLVLAGVLILVFAALELRKL